MPIELPSGIYWPFGRITGGTSATAGAVLNALNESAAFIGHIKLIDGATGTKTLDNSGSSKIEIRLGSVVFTAVGTTLRVGFQGIDNTTGIPIRPDGAWSAYRDFVAGSDSIASNTVLDIVPSAGTISLADGDRVCIVFELTAYAGASSITISTSSADFGTGASSASCPIAVNNTTGAWALTSGLSPILLTFSDGSQAIIDGLPYPGSLASISYDSSSSPNEHACIFQVPFDTKVDAIWTYRRSTDADSDSELKLYSDPLGTPVLLASVLIPAEDTGLASGNSAQIRRLASKVALSANTDYAVGLLATGSTSVRFERILCYHEEYRNIYPGGENIKGASRSGSSGAFGTVSTTTLCPCGVRICEIPDGGGGASGFPLSRLVM